MHLCHAYIKLSNVKLQFLPENTTAVMQPMDHRVIKMMKTHYKKYLLQSTIPSLGNCFTDTKLTKKKKKRNPCFRCFQMD